MPEKDTEMPQANSQKRQESQKPPIHTKIMNFDTVLKFAEISEVKSKSKKPVESKEAPLSVRKLLTNRENIATVSIELMRPDTKPVNAPVAAKIAKLTIVPYKTTILSPRGSERSKNSDYGSAHKTEIKTQEKRRNPSSSVNKIASPRNCQLPKSPLGKTREPFSNKNWNAPSKFFNRDFS